MKSIHLVCNAHLDPVWLWQWEEGAAETIATFSAAADFCEEFDGFVFNHNEAILYEWIEEFQPELFERIRKLVGQKKWHIMGGWYLQPDCNMPSGESFARQILLGREYFTRKFGVAPTTAINFDPFGHTRGLVQILAKSGYDSYIFCRPDQNDCALEKDAFVWQGYDGSRVLACRAPQSYLSHLGKARKKVESIMDSIRDDSCSIALWGVGNHGGGPSRVDLRELSDLMRERSDFNIRHSTPEAYFNELKQHADSLPIHAGDLNPWGVGCYTSQIEIKQKHRRLENELYATEKMASAAWAQGAMPYPKDELRQSMRDLATAQFHDILPGSCIRPAADDALRLMDHGLEILSRVKARAFFALARGQPKASSERIPVLVYNPHPFPVRKTIECEFQPQQWMTGDADSVRITAFNGNKAMPTQVERELSNLNMNWRKRAVFSAELAPSQMNRFDCQMEHLPNGRGPMPAPKRGAIRFKTDELDVVINARTGLIDRYRVCGTDYTAGNACRPLVFIDDDDPWSMIVRRYRKPDGAFRALSQSASAKFSGVAKKHLPPVRVIEDGPVRTVVEALFGFGSSRISQRYKLPKQGHEIEVEVFVLWNEKSRMLKWSLPTVFADGECRGQVAYGSDTLPDNGNEFTAQKWMVVVSKTGKEAFTVINNGTYGADFMNGELRLSLLRSPAYSAVKSASGHFVLQDRFTPRIDQGERAFKFWLNAGAAGDRLASIDRDALVHAEEPMALSFCPTGGGDKLESFLRLSDNVVQIAAVKKSERGDFLIIRLFEPTGHARTTVVELPFARMREKVSLGPFEIRTYKIDLRKRAWTQTNLMEE